jgi:hypothetical protein
MGLEPTILAIVKLETGLEPVNIKWITLTPGRAVQYNGELEIERMWQQV